MHSFLVSTVAFIVLVGLMVIVHEFGHFAVAKLCRVRVEAFSFGFGPRLFGFKYGDTDYKVCLLPLGGFVKMTGENPGEPATLPNPSLDYEMEKRFGKDAAELSTTPDGQVLDPGAFPNHPRWQRMLIGVAGPAANFILAFVLMFIYFVGINEVYSVRPPQLEWVTPGSVADKAGLKPGDAIVAFGALAHPDLGSLFDAVAENQGSTVPVTVERGSQTVTLSLSIPADGKGEESNPIGFPHYIDKPLTIDRILPGSAAEAVGLHSGDQLLAIDGHAFHTLDPLADYLRVGQGKPLTLTVLTAGGVQETLVAHPHSDGGTWLLGITPQPYGDSPMRRAPLSVSKAVTRSLDLCAWESKMIGQILGKLFTHKASVKQLSGPVGIAVAAGKAAEAHNWNEKFSLAAGISLNLGILNLLPFPILDGGLILFLLIESILRRDISLVIKERIYQAAFIVIIVFFAFVIFNDVSNLPVFSHFHR